MKTYLFVLPSTYWDATIRHSLECTFGGYTMLDAKGTWRGLFEENNTFIVATDDGPALTRWFKHWLKKLDQEEGFFVTLGNARFIKV